MAALKLENVWLQQQKFADAELLYARLQAGTLGSRAPSGSSLASDIAQVRQGIQDVLNAPAASSAAGAGGDSALYKRLEALEKENKDLRKITDELRALILTVQASVGGKAAAPAAAPSNRPAKPAVESDDDDDDCDLFGDDDEDEEELARIKEERVAAYKAKKAAKPALIAKSNVIFDVKPWDDETDMKEVERLCRTIEMDGLLWGAATLVEIGYGIKKLRITTVIEDAKVSTEDLIERITEGFEDHVQSVDIAAFNKI